MQKSIISSARRRAPSAALVDLALGDVPPDLTYPFGPNVIYLVNLHAGTDGGAHLHRGQRLRLALRPSTDEDLQEEHRRRRRLHQSKTAASSRTHAGAERGGPAPRAELAGRVAAGGRRQESASCT